ncbi:NAD(P)/FAD-dependent oxidoreductase [Alkanindiges illinoisensis]|uniref:NAD(P)/FAD-dependent oxidoreductase n=1 Tax=Alkanindiges illinoisensis TaxID=197183 RepID=UPI000683E43F|nr:NAD(P)/FAD-dependent oxidoreductase [Alkanindiges illinoisensis]
MKQLNPSGQPHLHRIVIVGGGAGGLELATRLGQSLGKHGQAQVILIDATLTHIWKPLLHEVAAGTINSYEDELNYFAHASKHHFEFHLGRMCDIDREHKQVILEPLSNGENVVIAPERRVRYDTLVVAVGSTSNDFGTKGARENCIFLDARPQADRFQREFLSLYLQAQARSLSDQNPQFLNIAIIGAGATGVELAAELHHAAHELPRYGLTSIDPRNVNISLIEAAERILPGLPPQTSHTAERELKKMGINVMTSRRVVAITENAIECDGDIQIPANLKVWSAGIKAPDFLKNIAGLETNRINQLVVGPSLQTTLDPDIFAMGDCASYIPEGESRPVPPRAQVANQQSILLAKSMKARLKGQPLPHFKFTDKGSLVSLSQKNSVGNLMGDINVQGIIARLMYVSLYRLHQVAIHGFFKTAVLMAKDLLSRSSGPRLKLH